MPHEVKVITIKDVLAHENADRLEVALIQDYTCVVPKGQFQPGDAAVYIPVASVVPPELLQEMGLWDHETGKGKLAGPDGVRLRAQRFRGVVSQGLLLRPPRGFIPGDEAGYHLGITKWDPPIPQDMTGQIKPAEGLTPEYDIDNILGWPDILRRGESVVYTEKIHGTFSCFAHVPGAGLDYLIGGDTVICSKALLGKHSFYDTPENESNVYVRAFKDQLLHTGKWQTLKDHLGEETPFALFGEIYGTGVQDLGYGRRKNERGYALFDVRIGDAANGRYLNPEELQEFASAIGLPAVPVLYRGPHSQAAMEEHLRGRDTFSGSHAREGIVITPVQERDDWRLGTRQAEGHQQGPPLPPRRADRVQLTALQNPTPEDATNAREANAASAAAPTTTAPPATCRPASSATGSNSTSARPARPRSRKATPPHPPAC